MQDDVTAVTARHGRVAEHLEAGTALVPHAEGGSRQGERAEAGGKEAASHVKPGRADGR